MRTGEQVKEAVDAGADIIVTGTLLEEGGGVDKIRALVDCIKTDRRSI
jgi:heptaprenylglyceryl phosphate synthase